MATYVVSFSFTQRGMEDVRESPARVEAAKQTFKAVGAQVGAFYAVMGAQYDTLFIVEAPNDETVAKAALSIGSLGNVRTETHRAFTEDEYHKMIGELP